MKHPIYGRGPGSQSRAMNFSIGGTNVASTSSIDGIKAGMDLIRRRINEPQDILMNLANIGLEGIRERLETAGHGEWPSLKPSTIAKRKMKGTSEGAIFPDQPILNETGSMFRSIKILRITNKTVNIGSRGGRDARVLAEHEEGGGNLPYRSLLTLDSSMLQEIHTYLYDVLDELIKNDQHGHAARVKKGRLFQSFIHSPASTSTVDRYMDGGVNW